MHGHLTALMAKHPKDVCVVVLPVPLESFCNQTMDPGDAGHPGSCEISRLALAVWRANPAAFAGFHERTLMASSIEAIRRDAESLAPGKLEAELSAPWMGEVLQANIADWVAFSKKSNRLPKLLITGRRILHGLPSGTEDFVRVMEKELGL
jgi:hypothetical protein